MNKEKLTRLSQIYNTLCLIEVKGQNAIHMGRCLEALEDFIVNEERELKNQAVAPAATD